MNYDSPNCLEIRSNIHAQQSKLLLHLYDMAFVASNADAGFVITPPIKSVVLGKKHDEYEHQYQKNLESSAHNFEKNIKLSRKLDRKVNAREFLFNQISSVYPDFCRNIESKISPEDYTLYRKNKNALRAAITIRPESYTDFDEILFEHQDKLSTVIDSEEFAKACNIEDTFVISELDRFFEILATLPHEQSRPLLKKSIKLEGSNPVSISDLAQKVRKERMERGIKYSHIHELYQKLSNHPYIKVEQMDHEEDEK